MQPSTIIADLRAAQLNSTDSVREVLQRAIELIEMMGLQLGNFKWLASQKYRRSSEKLAPGQLAMEFIAHLVSTATSNADEAKNEEKTGEEGKEKRPKRKSNIKVLPVVVVEKKLEEKERVCDCGSVKKDMGFDTRRQIIYQPAKIFMQEERLRKYACGPCAAGVVMAQATPKLVEKSLASSSLLAHLVVSKVIDSTPVERIGKQLARHGADIAPSTLYDWFGQAGTQVACLQPHIRKQLCTSGLISLDDTPLPTKNLAHIKNIQRGRLWLYLGDMDTIAYSAFSEDWKGTHPCGVLNGFSGDIQGDGYGGINALFTAQAPPTRIGCHDHARRKFVEAVKMGDPRANAVVDIYRHLYAVERDAKDFDPADRLAMRQAKSVPIWSELDRCIGALAPHAYKKGPLGKAVTYWTRQRTTLQQFLKSGHRPISNGHVERQLRVVALLRKNALFMGSVEAGHRYAALLTMALNCALCGANPFKYFVWLFNQLALGVPAKRALTLLPQAWLKMQQTAEQT
jgi:transposase